MEAPQITGIFWASGPAVGVAPVFAQATNLHNRKHQHGLPDRIDGYYHQDDWDLVALKAAFAPQQSAGLVVRAQFVSDTISAWVDIPDQQMEIGLGESDEADLTIDGTVEDLFVSAKDPGALLASGSRKKLDQFMSAFAL